jgi:DNA mismatch repair ATPase MutL
MDNHYSRYMVVRYPTYFVVIDQHDSNHKIVFESRSNTVAHKKCDKLNKEYRLARGKV